MFRFLLPILGFLAFVMPQIAEARGIPVVRETEQHLQFVADTQVPSPSGGKMALCHFYERNTVYWVGAWLSSNGYVLSSNACSGIEYYSDDAMITQAFESGAISADVPRSPSFTAQQMAMGYTWPGIIVILLLFLVIRAMRAARRYRDRSAERAEVLGLSDDATFRFVDAMLHAANADGQAQPEEIAFIKAKATEITKLDYTDEHIGWAITHTDRLKRQSDFRRFGKGLSKDQRRVILRAALAVVASDGQMTKSEIAFVEGLTQGLKLGRKDVDAILRPATA